MIRKSLKKSIQEEKGIALLMVITTIAILAALIADFSFETNINKLKTYNFQDKVQARINAESGLKFAMAKLRIYKEGRNLIEKTESLKKVLKPSILESVAIQPFAFPIPSDPKANLTQKTAIKEFNDDTVLQGTLFVTIAPVSGFLNPNNMRITKAKKEDETQSDDPDKKGKSPQAYIEDKLLKTLTDSLKEKSEQDDEFDALYGNVDPNLLIKELKYYVSDPEFFNDTERGEIEGFYAGKGITPKHAPLTSIDELYLLEGWSDDIVDLIKDRLTVHEVSIIPVNTLTEAQLKIIFPDITPEQLEEFFRYRDGDQELNEKGQEFKSADEFKSVVTGQLAIVSAEQYEERMKEFESAGLRIGVAGKFYKIISTGKFRRASYKITAFVDLPIKPQPVKKKEDDGTKGGNGADADEDEDGKEVKPPTDPKTGDDKKDKPVPMELLEPRVVEIRVG